MTLELDLASFTVKREGPVRVTFEQESETPDLYEVQSSVELRPGERVTVTLD